MFRVGVEGSAVGGGGGLALIGLRWRTFTSIAEFVAVGPVWPGTVIRGVYVCFSANAATTMELAPVCSIQPSENLAALEAGAALFGPGDEPFPGSSVPCAFLPLSALDIRELTFPIYFPVESAVCYVLLGLRASGAQTVRLGVGLFVEVDRQVTQRVEVVPGKQGMGLERGIGRLLGAGAAGARLGGRSGSTSAGGSLTIGPWSRVRPK